MKRIHTVAKVSFLLISFFFQSFSIPSGGDYYKVLLNNKLITEQYLSMPASMKTLSLTSANSNDRLVVYYSHCGTAGKGRTVSIKNASGVILKQWKFDDSKTIALQLPVKDVLDVSAKKGNVFLYYSSRELPSGKQLLSINLLHKTIAKL